MWSHPWPAGSQKQGCHHRTQHRHRQASWAWRWSHQGSRGCSTGQCGHSHQQGAPCSLSTGQRCSSGRCGGRRQSRTGQEGRHRRLHIAQPAHWHMGWAACLPNGQGAGTSHPHHWGHPQPLSPQPEPSPRPQCRPHQPAGASGGDACCGKLRTPAGTLGAHGGWSCGHSCQRCPRGARGRKGHAVHPPPRLHWPLSTPQTHPPACPPSLLHSSPAAGLPQHQLRWWSRQLKRRPRSAPAAARPLRHYQRSLQVCAPEG
mmetsp:Transcript_16856/g.44096  ORF Transcript_16856/g.44096 Transcript_16856/m.44096 type:complete len:259 (-) Transcript_16856:1409-2185(-)